jgi:pimeloyl-ACP methyl ester carboxylesterase
MRGRGISEQARQVPTVRTQRVHLDLAEGCLSTQFAGDVGAEDTHRAMHGVPAGRGAGLDRHGARPVLCIYLVCTTMPGMVSQRVRCAALLLIACVLGAACVSAPAGTPAAVPSATPGEPPPTDTPSPTPTATTPAATPLPELERKVGVDGSRLYIHCMGAGTPAVIMEAGYDDVGETWSLVQPEVARHTCACAYDRAGLGKSDPGPEAGSALEAVTALHALLADAGIEGPYLLVGHSLGGEYVRLYAAHYPEEVVGLVLVDSAHPDQWQRSAAVLPPPSPSDSEGVQFYREWFTGAAPDPTLSPALYDPGSLGDLPLVVLSAPDKQRADDVPAELNASLNRVWLELQQELALLSTNSRHVISHKSDHFIQQDEPELVIEAILWALGEASR